MILLVAKTHIKLKGLPHKAIQNFYTIRRKLDINAKSKGIYLKKKTENC